jgi:hypothetical protein
LILAAIYPFLATGDLEVVASQALYAESVSGATRPDDREHSQSARGALARFRDAKGREFTIISSDERQEVHSDAVNIANDVHGYVVCRYGADGTMDRILTSEQIKFRQDRITNFFSRGLSGELKNGLFKAKAVINVPNTTPLSMEFSLAGFAQSKPHFSMTEAVFLFGLHPATNRLSLVDFDNNQGRLYGVKLQQGWDETGSLGDKRLLVALSQSSNEKEGISLGAFDDAGNVYTFSSPTFLRIGKYGYNFTDRSSKTTAVPYSPAVVTTYGSLSDDRIEKLSDLIPVEWRK